MDPGMPEAPGRFELPNRGFADLRLTTWLRRQQGKKDRHSPPRSQAAAGVLAGLTPAGSPPTL